MLRARLRDYFEFQQRKKRDTDTAIIKALPRNLLHKLCSHLYADVVQRNQHLLGGCNPQFINQLLARHTPISLSPHSRIGLHRFASDGIGWDGIASERVWRYQPELIWLDQAGSDRTGPDRIGSD